MYVLILSFHNGHLSFQNSRQEDPRNWYCVSRQEEPLPLEPLKPSKDWDMDWSFINFHFPSCSEPLSILMQAGHSIICYHFHPLAYREPYLPRDCYCILLPPSSFEPEAYQAGLVASGNLWVAIVAGYAFYLCPSILLLLERCHRRTGDCLLIFLYHTYLPCIWNEHVLTSFQSRLGRVMVTNL